MPKAQTVNEVLEQVASDSVTQRENAVALHNYMRENVKFGFNKFFDAGTSDYTLTSGYGHCIPKGHLMLELFQGLGLKAHLHFVVVPKAILKGAIPSSRFWMIPGELSHSFIEVNVDGVWCKIDSYIIDTPLLKGAQAKLAKENLSIGYGVRADSVNIWDGKSDAFSQFDQGLVIEDHGRIDDLDVYFRSKQYRHVVLGMSFNTMFKLMGESGVAPINANIESIRQY
jgi:hypothetical protein